MPEALRHFLYDPWPWYVAGPIIGLFVPVLLLAGNRMFGISSNLRHACAIVLPSKAEYFRYNWASAGLWNLLFAFGILLGGMVAGAYLTPDSTVAISASARESIAALGVTDFNGLVPNEIFSWAALATWQGLVVLVGGGFLVGFGASYAGGCTSGHAISGLADLQLPSLIATLGFFAGGLVSTWVLLPLIFGGAS